MNKTTAKKLKEYAVAISKDKALNVHGISTKLIYKRVKKQYVKGNITL